MHQVLIRQIKKIFGEQADISPQWTSFLELVSNTYAHFDEEQVVLERSFEISSKELMEHNRELKEAKEKLEQQARFLAHEVELRTADLHTQITELENTRKAMTNLLADFIEEQTALKKAKAQDEALLESVGEGLIAVDGERKVIFINKFAVELLGWSAEELTHKVISQMPLEDEHGNLIPPLERPTARAIKTKKTVRGNYFFVRKNNTRFPIFITAAPILLDEKPHGVMVLFHDITMEKEIDRAKTEFVSLASHQLRTPLSTINWYMEMLLDANAGSLNEQQKKYADAFYASITRMVSLVNALLNVSRIELGTFVIEPEPTDVVALMREVIDEIKPYIQQNFSFSAPRDEHLAHINVDPKLLRTVFQNILSNAVKYTPEHGSISVSLSSDEHANVLLKVADTGYGIPKQQQDKIFTKLFRADNVREKNTEGTGLGLYIVKSIIDHSGGKVWFESEENKGTTFYVTIPLSGMKKKAGEKTLV